MAKVKVNHNGSCNGYSFTANEPFEVQDSDVGSLVAALGNDAKVLEEVKADKAAVENEGKEVKAAPVDKMVKTAKTK